MNKLILALFAALALIPPQAAGQAAVDDLAAMGTIDGTADLLHVIDMSAADPKDRNMTLNAFKAWVYGNPLADSFTADHLADDDWGPVSIASNVLVLDTGGVTSAGLRGWLTDESGTGSILTMNGAGGGLTVTTTAFDGNFANDASHDTVQELVDVIDDLSLGSTGYVIRTAIVRTGAAGTWTLLDDVSHSPLGIASIAQDSGEKTITLTYDTAITGDVYTAFAVPDETLAGVFDFGMSVGSANTVITITAMGTVGGRAYYNGAAWSTEDFLSNGGNLSGAWNETDNHYQVNIPNWCHASLTQVSDWSNTAAAVPRIKTTSNTAGSKYVRIEFTDQLGGVLTSATAAMGFHFTAAPIVTAMDPAHINSTDFSSGNIWVAIISEN